MKRSTPSLIAAVLALAACSARSEPSADQQAAPADAVANGGNAAQRAAVRFMRDMIVHHGQALEMAALVPDRAADEAVRRLALRIDAAQRDEIARMRRWLSMQGETVADAHASHAQHTMAGMLSPQEMARLETASGETFDRLFIEGMIRHHEGALAMVAELLAQGGATHDVEVFTLASQIDADQRAEIARMRRMLGTG